ncbi:MAG: DNA gyrase subunit A, partial [Gemmatimonadetes bacterium]|nr:DNA gyrase subunit A [Gemmatimonadota bacterium]
GIAVGMATNIPPHNLREIGAALRHLIEHADCSIDDLIALVPGPDFPTGAFILGRDGIRDAYATGRGRIVMRAAVHKEALRGGKEQLVVTGLPYGVSKARVIEQIAALARGNRMPDAVDLRDESDRDGMRIILELKRGARVGPVLSLLYKQTHLQSTFGAIMLALDHGVPRELPLKEMLERFRDHRLEVIRCRSQHDLAEAQARAHIVEGLLTALDRLDEVIEIIRSSEDQEAAAARLKEALQFSAEQAAAILAMRLSRLTELETSELHDELKELRKRIRSLHAILKSPKRQREVLLEELDEVVQAFGDDRRTTILDDVEEHEVEDLEAEEQVVISLSHAGYIKRVPMALYRRRVARGKAQSGMDRYEDDFLEHVFVATSTDTLVFFSAQGQAYALAVHDVPEAGPGSRGRALAQVLTMDKGTRIAALVPVSDFAEDRSLVFLTRNGTIKRTSLDQFGSIRAGGIAAIRLAKKDAVLDVQQLEAGTDVVIVTRQGRAIRFPESEIPVMGRVTLGVRGIRLGKGDAVVGMVVVRRDATLCTVTELGYAKRTPLSEYPAQKRGGLGTITLDVSDRTGPLVAAKEVLEGDELMVIAASGSATRLRAPDVPIQGRATQGKRVIQLDGADRVVDVARVAQERDENNGHDNAGNGDDDPGARTRSAPSKTADQAGSPSQLSLMD